MLVAQISMKFFIKEIKKKRILIEIIIIPRNKALKSVSKISNRPQKLSTQCVSKNLPEPSLFLDKILLEKYFSSGSSH